MNELKNTTTLVKSILEQDVRTRNSDSLLYLKVIERIADKEGVNLYGISVPMFLANMSAYPYFPGFETVRRTRQKVQAENPTLGANERVGAFRSEREREFRAWAVDHDA